MNIHQKSCSWPFYDFTQIYKSFQKLSFPIEDHFIRSPRHQNWFWPEPELGPIKSLQIPLKELLNSDEPDQCFCSNRNFRSLIAGLKIGYLPVSSSHQIAVNLSM